VTCHDDDIKRLYIILFVIPKRDPAEKICIFIKWGWWSQKLNNYDL